MNDEIFDLLESDSPEDRKRAVKMLAKTGDSQALEMLSDAYKYETDDEVKDLIVKAGKYIKKQMKAPKWEASKEVHEKPKNEPPEDEYVEVGRMQEERAQGLVNQAMDYSVSGDNAKAVQTLKKAFKINPNLRYDDMASGLAGELMGGHPQDAVDAIASGSADEKVKRKAKEKRGGGDEEEITWGTALVDLAIYTLVIAGIFIVGMLLVFQVADTALAALVEELYNSPALSFETGLYPEDVEAFRAGLFGFGVIGSVLYGVMTGISSVIGLMIYYFFVHITAQYILSGDGSYPRLVHKTATVLTIITAVSALLSFGYMFLWINGLAGALTTPDMTPNMIEAQFVSLSNSFAIIGLLSFVVSILLLFWFGGAIGNAYDFGMGKGCVTIIISYVLMMVVSFACTCAFSTMLGSFFGSMFEAAFVS